MVLVNNSGQVHECWSTTSLLQQKAGQPEDVLRIMLQKRRMYPGDDLRQSRGKCLREYCRRDYFWTRQKNILTFRLAFRVLDGLCVREHERKYSQHLSGGTKRKLSYAIAIMASAPQIGLMEGPSTGMETQSKRL